MDIKELNLTLPSVSLNYDWSEGEDYHYTTLANATISFYSIILVLGIIGNGLVIWIAGFRMKKTISAVWFLNLAIADFLCCASLPVQIAAWALIISYSGIFICTLSAILFTLNMSASVFTLTAMSIDRCVSIMWPIWAKVHRTRKVVRITVAIIWVLSLILTGLVFILYAKHDHSDTEWCFFGTWLMPETISQLSETVRQCRLIIMFVIPFLIISISYAFIFFKLRKSKRPRRSQRPYRIITAVILCFFICWSPYYIWPLIPSQYVDFTHEEVVYLIINSLSFLNSCINPIIYVFMGQDFQHSFLRSIPFRLERALREQPNDQCEEQGGSGSTRTAAV